MRISLKHRFIALSNPRCGSTSVRRALNPFSDLKSKQNCDLAHHSALRTVEKYLVGLGYVIDDFFIFTTVRNPWARAVSIYHYGLKNPQSAWHKPAVSSSGFSEFLQQDMLYRHFRPQMASAPLDNGPYQISRFCADSNGVIKGRAFKLEAINELENEIFNARGIRISIPHVNQTEHNAYQDYYDEKSRKQVEFLFREDIDMFGYEFDGKSNYPNGY